MHNHGIAKAHGLSSWESACHLKIPDFPLIPVAFLTHTHSLGIFSGGWVIQNGTWTSLGQSDPQLPQTFRPVSDNSIQITGQDILAMRCIMSSDRDFETLQGLSKHSEMCDYFVLYKTLGSLLSETSCTTNATFTWKTFGLSSPYDNKP